MAKSPRSGENRGRRSADRRKGAEQQAPATEPTQATADTGGAATSAAGSAAPVIQATGTTPPRVQAISGRITSTSGKQVTKEQIAHRAYQLYVARGGTHGYDIEDWLKAERELRGK